MKLACAYLSGMMTGMAALAWDWWRDNRLMKIQAAWTLTVVAALMCAVMLWWIFADRKLDALRAELEAARERLVQAARDMLRRDKEGP